jgi:hypothetical protein
MFKYGSGIDNVHRTAPRKGTNPMHAIAIGKGNFGLAVRAHKIDKDIK